MITGYIVLGAIYLALVGVAFFIEEEVPTHACMQQRDGCNDEHV